MNLPSGNQVVSHSKLDVILKTSSDPLLGVGEKIMPVNPPKAPVSAPSTVPLTTDALESKWDGWPDGIFQCEFTFKEVSDLNNLHVHWATRTNGRRGGDDFAESWMGGKRRHKQCLGVIECDNPDCFITVRPQTSQQGVAKQVNERCRCGAVLFHQKCNVKLTLWMYLKGVCIVNDGFHQHRRPGHILHISKDEQVRFQALVNTHPTVGPLGLIVGVPGVTGPGESVADISDVFLNAGRVGKERLKLTKGSHGGGDEFLAAFAKFSAEHPGFVIFSHVDVVTVISVQSAFMRSQMVKERLLDGPTNGLVNDAAHGWWKERNSLLMVTSSYCPDLFCWVPGVLSYTNGASSEHFKYHFLGVFQSIAHEAELRKFPVIDQLFAGVRQSHSTFPNIFLTCYTLRSWISVKLSDWASLWHLLSSGHYEETIGLMKSFQSQGRACCGDVRSIFEQVLHVLHALMEQSLQI